MTIQATHTFPRGFKWGTATAAHQVEGQPGPSDWAAWEKLPDKIRSGGSAVLACDWWGGRWREDFDRAAATGQTTHRLSVDWSRIEPRLAVWDEEALDHYRQMVIGLRQRGLAPMVTLHHFANPIWLAEMGGWENPKAIQYFERFACKVVKALKDQVELWCTFNEINVYAYQSYLEGAWPPGQRNLGAFLKVTRHLLMAHANAYRAIHQLQPTAQIGVAHHVQLIDPAQPTSFLDRWVARLQYRLFNDIVPQALQTGRLIFPAGQGLRSEARPELANTFDFVGLNYYSRRLAAFDLSKPSTLFGRTFHSPEAEVDNLNLNELYPEGLYRVLQWANYFGKPIYITENGWGDDNEDRRLRALVGHLRQVWRGVNFNWPIKAYYYWTLVDNFEWERGWEQRFGLYELDPASQVRTPRPTAHLYAEICQTHTLSADMIARFTPNLTETLFPG